jgi:type I restriction enzyme S subunit
MAGDLINGDIPDHWEFTTLGEICQRGGGNIQTGPFGSQLHASDYVPVGIPSIMPTNIGDNRIIEDGIVRITEEDANRLGQHRLKAGDIVYSRRGDVEKRALIREREEGWLCGTGCLKVRLGSGVVDPLFASLFLGHPAIREWIVRHAVGATMPNLNTSIMSAVPFALPPLAEQKAIAAVLGALDDKIELNRRMNATLEAMARALFQSWFVDFDPVRAKLDGRPPASLDPATAALFPDHFEDSELGEIPRGWAAQRLPDVIDVNPRRTLKSGTIAPYLDMKNLPTQGHSAEEVIDREFSSGTKFQNGDTLLARITPCLENGKTGYVDFLEDGQVGWGSTEYIVLSPKLPLPPQFGYLLARSDALRTHAIQNMTGTSGRQRVPSECFHNFWLAVPPPAIARRFDELTAPLMAKIKANSTESRTLATLRDTLLPKLLSGEVQAPVINS